MATVELYHFWSSVCSVRARMALEEKGVVWTSRYIDLGSCNRFVLSDKLRDELGADAF
jgi:glutathione S-transferase